MAWENYIPGSPQRGDYMWMGDKPVTFWGYSDGLALYIPGHVMSRSTACGNLTWGKKEQ